jgi:hypothetical protein
VQPRTKLEIETKRDRDESENMTRKRADRSERYRNERYRNAEI